MKLTTEFQKILESSTKVTQNVTGYLRLYLKYGSRDDVNNKDIIYYEIRQYAHNPYGNYLSWEWSGSLAWNIKLGTAIKAEGKYTQSAVYSNGKEIVRASGSWEQPHNVDGTWSSAISFEGYVYQTKVSASSNIELPDIPRATTIQATDAKINSISTIYLSINSNTFYHKLYYKTPSDSDYILIAENVKENYHWKVPDNVYNVMSGKEIRLTILCKTYNSSGGFVGENTTTMLASAVESDARPTFDVTFQNEGIDKVTGKLTGSNQTFIKDYSTAILDVTIGLRKNATLKEYKVVNSNKSSTTQDTSISAIPTKTFTFYVKDSRDYYPEQGYPLTKDVPSFIDYFSPRVNSPAIQRTEQTSTEIVANISGQFWNGNFGKVQNTLKYSWRSKLSRSNEWGEWSSCATPTISGSNFYINNLSLGDIYATNSSYDFQFKFVDELGNLDSSKIVTTATQNVTVSTPIIEVYDDAVNINGDILMNESPIIETGNNDDGRWIKYADGTMICASNLTRIIENNISWNGFYIGVIDAIKFPLGFVTIDSCSIDLYCYRNLWKMSGGILGTTGISNMYTISPESFTSDVNIVLTAVGRWK